MKPHFACLLTVLLSTLVFAQSNPLALKRPPLSKNLSQLLQGAHSTQRRAGTFEVTAARRGALPMQRGLNFAPVVTYGPGGGNRFL